MASVRYLRKREYPHPPPPSRNNTRRTINRVDISYLLSIQCSEDWGQRLKVCETKKDPEAPASCYVQVLPSIRQEVLAGRTCCLIAQEASALLQGASQPAKNFKENRRTRSAICRGNR